MGLITETNEEYYAGEKVFLVPTNTASFATTFNTELTLDSPTGDSNFLFEISTDSGATYSKYSTLYPAGVVSLSNNNKTIDVSVPVTGAAGTIAKITLKIGAVESNYGGYQYVKLNDIINTFIAICLDLSN